MDDVFKALIESGVPFAVFVFMEEMKIKGMEASGRGYYVAILKRDKKKLQGFRFKQSSEYTRTVAEYELKDLEVANFKNNMDSYTKVFHNKEGRVYELKGGTRPAFKVAHQAYRDEIEA